MQMKLLIVLALVGAAVAIPSRCVVSDWGEWTECRGAEHTPGESHAEPEGEIYDEGRATMKAMMEAKERNNKMIAECLAAGTCPELMAPESMQRETCMDGQAGDYPCENIDQLSFTSLVDLGFTSAARGNDIWVWEDGTDYYAIFGSTQGSSFVRITDPENVEVLGRLPTHTASSTWRDMKVVRDHAFIGSEASGHGLQIFDLTQLRGLSADRNRVFSNTAHYAGFGNSHNIVSNPETDLIVAVGCTRTGAGYSPCSGGLHMIDVSDPVNPVFEGCFSSDGYTHDAECVVYDGPDARYRGDEICFGYNENTLTIVNIQDRQNPVQISRTSYTGFAYTHQGWLTTDHEYLLLDDELDESRSTDKRTRTYLWDVRNLDSPIMRTIHWSTENSIDHNLYIVERDGLQYVYQSNYESGMRVLIFNSDDPENIFATEVGFFDCFPSRTTANFEGTWSNYPWLPNGAIAMTSINYGFFMLQPDYTAMSNAYYARMNESHQSRYRSILSNNSIGECPILSQTQTC